ncbi:replicative DNA helicase [Propionibacterium freudenreichii]|nr:Replicative DNA helicase [Propionibacterium freudenreichii subsp. shermanii]SBN59173.1 Replicative DNA helicase [Propionibacterium freudenreichii]SBT28392.1 Replicative DNA helicase [Propionibacterium freudenreichii]SCQ47420.1 Replicative DNA helicase [Propionibacterium freudenreichii]SCQ51025.1 Replicative DNA helicase [Propionibacterium freudenreichii]
MDRPPLAGDLDRTPPQDVGAEQSVLGAMLMSKDAIADVIEEVRPQDFYRPAHETIYEAIIDLYGRGEPADAVTVAAELDKRGELERVGGRVGLVDLMQSISIAANAGYYAQIVHDKATLRRLVDASMKIAQLGYQGAGDVPDIVDAAQQTIYEVSEGKTSEDYKSLKELLEPTIDEMEAIESHTGVMSGVPTGFIDLDELTNGLHGGQMIIVAARPAVGKSTLALDFARSAAVSNKLPCAYFSLEMSQTELVMRLLSAEATVPLNHIRNGKLNDEEWDQIVRKAGQVQEAPLFIDDSPNLTMMEIRAKARRLKQRNDLKLIIIDYLQLMSSGRKVESRQLEVSEFSRQIKLLAKELSIPVVALCQLNRGPEQRNDKKPMLSDLRESGSLEQDADMVILLHREDVYDRDSPRAGEADFIVAKHRNGPTATITTAFQGHYSRFVDMQR